MEDAFLYAEVNCYRLIPLFCEKLSPTFPVSSAAATFAIPITLTVQTAVTPALNPSGMLGMSGAYIESELLASIANAVKFASGAP